MPATSADIGLATRPNGVTLATASDTAVQTTHPNARDGAESPAPGFWDTETDALALAAERFDLLKVPRRRFQVEVAGVQTALLPASLTPVVNFTDAEMAAAGNFLVSRILFDLDAGRTTLELWG